MTGDVSGRRVSAFTLVELLVVIAIIGVLIALLLPAVQSVRESARRIQCANNMKELGLAAHNFESALSRIPSGFMSDGFTNRTESFVQGSIWSSSLLPHLEQQNVRNLYGVDVIAFGGDLTGVMEACTKWIPGFRCPSTTDPEKISAWWNAGIDDRVPCSYLGCGSGTSWRESGTGHYVGDKQSDGVMFRDSWVTVANVTDGLSNTVIFGEAFNALGIIEQLDFNGHAQHVDHWYIWSRDLIWWRDGVESTESSEAIGSTAARINATKIEEAHINEKELCYSSRHAGNGVNLTFCDGHVRFVTETIDPVTFSAMGTRNGSETVDDF